MRNDQSLCDPSTECLLIESLTVSYQHQGALGFGLAVVDLDGVSALAGSGEIIHGHLDDPRGHVVAHLVSLRRTFIFMIHQENKSGIM